LVDRDYSVITATTFVDDDVMEILWMVVKSCNTKRMVETLEII
jgi:hypothetical protein